MPREDQLEAKLVRVLACATVNVAVDFRPGAPTCKQHVAVRLSGEESEQLFIHH